MRGLHHQNYYKWTLLQNINSFKHVKNFVSEIGNIIVNKSFIFIVFYYNLLKKIKY